MKVVQKSFGYAVCIEYIRIHVGPISGAPNVNFWKISVRKTIWDLEFSEHLL